MGYTDFLYILIKVPRHRKWAPSLQMRSGWRDTQCISNLSSPFKKEQPLIALWVLQEGGVVSVCISKHMPWQSAQSKTRAWRGVYFRMGNGALLFEVSLFSNT